MPGDLAIRSQLANAERRRKAHPDDLAAQAAVDDLRSAYKASALADHIKRVVETAPPLTDAQRDQLAVLLRGGAAA